MKKTFTISHPKIQPERRIESFKFEIKKYINREREKKLPAGFDVWKFECKYGLTADSARSIEISEINPILSGLLAQGVESFYLEILSVASNKPKKAKLEEENTFDINEEGLE